jgi:hypothetical protein
METSGNPPITSAPRGGGDMEATAPRADDPPGRRLGPVAVGATVAQAVVLKAGFRAVAATGMALLLLGRPRTTPRERLEAVPVPVPNDQGADRRRVMVRCTARADPAATNEQVRGV